jgi:hypothetical protein
LKVPHRLSTVLLLLCLSLSILAGLPVARATSQTPSVPAALSVAVDPTTLPADSRVYPAVYVSLLDGSGQPTLAVSNITVLFSSSNPTVGSVLNSTLVILAGRAFAVADFETTSVAGTSTVTVSATGLNSASKTVNTAAPTGFPSQIVVSAVPSDVPSLPSYGYGSVIIELEDQAGLPAKAISDTHVQLISSNQVILNVSSQAVIGAGQVSVSASFTTGPVPGTASIIATSSGYQSGSTPVTVSGPAALALKLFALPSKLAACVASVTLCTGTLVVAVTDLSGNPVHAPAPILVHIRSNDTSRVNPTEEVVIPRGNVSSRISYQTTSNPGAAQITVSAAGLSSDIAVVKTYIPEVTVAGKQISLDLEVGPFNLPADDCKCGYATVSLVNASTGVPMIDPSSSESVTLTSSQAFVANFTNKQASITLNLIPGSSYVPTTVTSTFVVGATSLTASAQNRITSFAQVTTIGSVLSRLRITPLFNSNGAQIPADGAQHPAFELSLFDSSGNPVLAPPNTLVNLNSSAGGILSISSPVEIPSGRSAVIVNVTTGVVAGTSNVTAYLNSPAGSILVSSALVATVTPAPSSIAAYIVPSPFIPSPGNTASPLLILQLQNDAGKPARAHDLTNVSITSSNAQISNSTILASINQGGSYVIVPIHPLSSGTTTLTITSQGLATATVQLQVLDSPFAVRLAASSLSIFTNGTATVTLSMTIDGQGVSGANVTWSSTSGTVVPTVSTTNDQGQAAVTFRPTAAGVANVTAVVSSALAPTQDLSTQIIVAAVPQSNNKGLLGTLLSFPYVLLFVAVAAVAVIIAFVLIRRRRRGKEAEGALSEDEQGFSYHRFDPQLGPGAL